MKIVNIFFVTLFLLSAALQYNDPDPYIWMPLYLYGAWLCYTAIKNQYNPFLYTIGLVVYILYALFFLLDKDVTLDWWLQRDGESIMQSMKATKPWIEKTRELLGLASLIAALAINMYRLSKIKKQKLIINKAFAE